VGSINDEPSSVPVLRREPADESGSRPREQDTVRQLAAGIAHDFNNLLTSILCGASLTLDHLEEGHPARSTLEIISRSGEQAAGLVRQLMAYSGIGPFITSRLDVSELVRTMAGSLLRSLPERLHLRLDLAASRPVLADPEQLEQLIRSLVTNAVEAIDVAVGGTISIRTRAVRIGGLEDASFDLGRLDTGAYVQVEVSDTGCGMDDAIRHRIFDPFFSTKFPGRGLELAAAAGIVRAHRGAIRVESTPGSGSTFRVYLPAIKPTNGAALVEQAAVSEKVRVMAA
jgi:signal transduction histidine kinase